MKFFLALAIFAIPLMFYTLPEVAKAQASGNDTSSSASNAPTSPLKANHKRKSADGYYEISEGDTLQIEILEDPSFNRVVLVAPDGRVSVPLAGTFKVSDLTIEQIEKTLVSRLEGNFVVKPTVVISLRTASNALASSGDAITIYALGEVGAPGPLLVEDGTSLLQAIASIGGFSRFASTKRLQLRRTAENGKETIMQINYDDIVEGVSTSGLMTLEDGDIILVPQRGLFEL